MKSPDIRQQKKYMKKSMLKPKVFTTAPETIAANAPEMSSTESNTPRSIPLDGCC